MSLDFVSIQQKRKWIAVAVVGMWKVSILWCSVVLAEETIVLKKINTTCRKLFVNRKVYIKRCIYIWNARRFMNRYSRFLRYYQNIYFDIIIKEWNIIWLNQLSCLTIQYQFSFNSHKNLVSPQILAYIYFYFSKYKRDCSCYVIVSILHPTTITTIDINPPVCLRIS